MVGWGPWGEELNLVSSLLIELSFKVGLPRVGTLGGKVWDPWGVKFEFGFKF